MQLQWFEAYATSLERQYSVPCPPFWTTPIEEKCSFGHDPLWPLHCFVDLSKSNPFSNEIMPCVDASLSDVGSSVITHCNGRKADQWGATPFWHVYCLATLKHMWASFRNQCGGVGKQQWVSWHVPWGNIDMSTQLHPLPAQPGNLKWSGCSEITVLLGEDHGTKLMAVRETQAVWIVARLGSFIRLPFALMWHWIWMWDGLLLTDFTSGQRLVKGGPQEWEFSQVLGSVKNNLESE